MNTASVSRIALRLPAAAAAAERDFLRLGGFQRPGRSLQVTSRSLELDGRPWVPAMGEFHYSRYPADEWEAELHKVRAGGIDIVASYVFWNHHEAHKGTFDWQGLRDLRRFMLLAQSAGLYFYLRPGPWVHAEARLGGFPDWLVAGGAPLRSNDPGYLKHVERWFGAIGEQLRGLMWCDGGPVIGVQLENEYDGTGPGRGAEHIAELKRLAIEAGLTVPLYTVTGWPTLDIPPHDVVPVSGAYADGFWRGEAGPLPPSSVFLFNTGRTIGEMGNVGGTPPAGRIDPRHYPFFLAEAGGGMHVSYHRRPVVTADDVAATALVQLGSGATLYGTYMYHGGTNPHGPAGRLHETQASGYPNDVPVLGYDFRAPLGQYGQRRASYGRLRTLHLFMAAFGELLAAGDAVLPPEASDDPADRAQLRVALRGAGDEGFLFVNNHVRQHPMPSFDGVRLAVERADGDVVTLPLVRVSSGAYFVWPIGQRIGAATLRYATVQPLTRLVDGARICWVGHALPGIAAELCFERDGVRRIDAPAAGVVEGVQGMVVRLPASDAPQWVTVVDAEGDAQTLLVLPQALADACHHLRVAGRDRLVLAPHGAYVGTDGALVVDAPHDAPASVQIHPADGLHGGERRDGFAVYSFDAPAAPVPEVGFEVLRDEPTPPPLRMGPTIAWRGHAMPLAPDDAEFEQATRIRLHVAPTLATAEGRLMLEIDYVGDAARLYADDELVDDNFYDGEPWFVGVDRYARDGGWPRLELRIVAAHDDAPIFLEPAARQKLAATAQRAALHNVRATLWRSHRLPLEVSRG